MTNLVTFGFGASAALVLTLGFGIHELSAAERVCITDTATGSVAVTDQRSGRVSLSDRATGGIALSDEALRCLS